MAKLDRLAELEKRISTLEAVEEIRRLISEYASNDDNGDLENHLGLFTEDLNFVTPFSDREIRAKETLRDFLSDVWKKITHRKHIITNIIIDVDESESIAKAYWMLDAVQEGVGVQGIGNYLFRLRKTNLGWKIRDIIIEIKDWRKQPQPVMRD